MSSGYKFLWLNGPLQGRELSLPLGNLSIGPDGDVLATLEHVEQVDLLIDEAGVRLQSWVPTWIAGQPISEVNMLPLGQVIELAGVGILLGHCTDELQQQAIPSHFQTKAKKSWWLLATVSMLSMVLLATVLLAPAKMPIAELTQAQWLSQQLQTDGLNGVQAHWSKDGVVTLSGFCQDSQRMAQFLGDIKGQGILFIEQTTCGDQLIRNVKDVLVQNGFANALVTLGSEPSNVIISGAIQSGERWDKAVSSLNNLPGLVNWQVSNQVDSQLKPLISALRNKNLLVGLMIERINDAIVMTGKVSEQQQQQIMTVAQGLEPTHANGLKLVFQNIPVQNELNHLFNASVVTYGGNAQSPFIELSSGVRLSTGSKLDNGYVVEYMNIHGLDLSRAGELIHVPLIF